MCLEHDAFIAIEWFERNYMKLTKEKCNFLITGNKYEHQWVTVGKNQIWERSSGKMLEVNIDSKLNFDMHIESILNSAGRKLTVLVRMSNIIALPKLRVLIKSFFESQISYCPSVWMFCSRTFNNKINKLHESTKNQILYKDLSTFVQLLSRDEATTLHNHFHKGINYDLRKKADFVCNNPTTVQMK